MDLKRASMNEVSIINNDNSSSIDKHSKLSPVGQMFNGRSVFITGASGFIGRVLLEKLLRSYLGIKKIYILLRPKKNQNPSDRLHKQLLQVPIFDQIRAMENGKQLLAKIVVIAGDIALPKLGINDHDLEMMLQDETLSIVYHSAATIKFDEPIRQSVQLNLVATREIINLCRRLPNLIALCHVSTAYVNSDILDQSDIEEKLYDMRDNPQKLIKLSELMDENLMQDLKAHLVGQRPNTYTYTKALAEHLIVEEAKDLPVVIIRPSIVTCAWKGPLPGWVDNLNGPTGLLLAVGKGLLRSMLAIRSVVADIIPVDIVVNTMIASTYYTAKLNNKINTKQNSSLESIVEDIGSEGNQVDHKLTQKNEQQVNEKQSVENEKKCSPQIIHCTSGDIKPMYWGDMEDMFSVVRKYPSVQVLRYPFGTFKSNKYTDLLARIFVHFLPALIIDMICGLLGKKRQLLSVYQKLHSATAALAHFCCNTYYFKVRNIKQVEASLLDQRDKQDLYMDISGIDWRDYFDTYVLGARRYVLKEPDENLPEARKSFQRAYYIEIGLRVLLGAIIMALILPYLTQLITYYAIPEVNQT